MECGSIYSLLQLEYFALSCTKNTAERTSDLQGIKLMYPLHMLLLSLVYQQQMVYVDLLMDHTQQHCWD